MSYQVYNKPKNKGPRVLVTILILCVLNFILWLYRSGGGDLTAGMSQLTTQSSLDRQDTNIGETAVTEAPEKLYIKMKGTCYHYNQLNDAEKQVYQYLYQGFKEYESEIKIIPTDQDVCKRASYAFRLDHPEFFWAEDMTLWSSVGSNIVDRFTVTVPKDAKETKKRLKKIAEDILSGAPEDDYEKVKYIYEYIANNTDYVKDALDNQKITSVLINHASVCGGYSKTFLYLCDQAKIKCGYVAGDIVGRDTHAWNFVKIDGKYYWVDVTWGDPNFGYFKEDTAEKIHYDYLCATDNEVLKGRVLSNDPSYSEYDANLVFDYPKCSDMSLNFFIREGSYFSTYERQAVYDAILHQAADTERSLVVIKFSSDDVMEQAVDDIFGANAYWLEIGSQLHNIYGITVQNGDIYTLTELSHLVIKVR